MIAPTYNDEDGWTFPSWWPAFAQRVVETWHSTKHGDPAPLTQRTIGPYDDRHLDLETWVTPGDIGLGVNVDWEDQYAWSQSPARVGITVHLTVWAVSLTLWRRFRPRVEPTRDAS